MNLAKLLRGKVANRKLQRHLTELARVLEADNMEAFRKLSAKRGLQAQTPAVCEIAFHKTRLEMVGRISREKRLASAFWLKERGCTRPDGSDPFTAIEVSTQ